MWTLLIIVLVFLLSAFSMRHLLRKPKNLLSYGKWAVVTGSTDGIGKAIAEEFAKKKLNLVLVSRTLSKLQEQSQEIKTKFGVDVKVAAVDFSEENPSKFDELKKILSSLDVGILVNNVGMSYDHAEFYLDVNKDLIKKLLRVNINGTMDMTDIVLPGMVDRKRGTIINVSSASSLVNEPLYAVYSATKAFVNNYSVALHHEYKSKGVFIQAQLPAYVTTKLSKLRKPSLLIATPSSYAKAFVNQIGYEPLVVSFWSHDLQMQLARIVPESLLVKFVLLPTALGIRKRALEKKKAN